MVKYNCEQCGKTFSQKSHYDSHKRRKTPCDHVDKLKKTIDMMVDEKLKSKPSTEQIQDMIDVAVNEKLKMLNLSSSLDANADSSLDANADSSLDANADSNNSTNNNIHTPLRVLSLFTGIGGMDEGFCGNVIVHNESITNKPFIDHQHTIPGFVKLKNHNFESVFQNDILTGAKEVFGYNNDASHYNTKSICTLLEERYKFPEADVIIGGFPCQDFSHAGKRRGFDSSKAHNGKDKSVPTDTNRGMLYKSFVKVVEQVKPKMFVAENVYGLITMKNEPIKQIMQEFASVGYYVSHQVVYCPDFGIPQTRKRVIIMGISNIIQDELAPDWNYISTNRATCCIGNYYAHLTEPEASLDVSQQAYSKAKRLTKGQGQTEVDLQSFAPTMRAEHHGNIEFRRHRNSTLNPTEQHLPERRLSVREAGLAQTFSPEHVFSQKSTMTAYKYIGNAVPPLLGYLVADKVQTLYSRYF